MQAAPAKQLKRLMSASVTASSRLLKQDHRLITRGAMLKTLGSKPEVVVVSPILHVHVSCHLRRFPPQLTWLQLTRQQMLWHAHTLPRLLLCALHHHHAVLCCWLCCALNAVLLGVLYGMLCCCVCITLKMVIAHSMQKVTVCVVLQDKLVQGVSIEEEQLCALQHLLPDEAEKVAIDQFCKVS